MEKQWGWLVAGGLTELLVVQPTADKQCRRMWTAEKGRGDAKIDIWKCAMGGEKSIGHMSSTYLHVVKHRR